MPAAVAEYAFLLDRHVDRATLDRSIAAAAQWGVAPHEVMLALGWLEPRDYVASLARHLGLPVVDRPPVSRPLTLVDATVMAPGALARHVAALGHGGLHVALEAPASRPGPEHDSSEATRLARAIHLLSQSRPDLSAAAPLQRWQAVAIAVLVGLIVGGLAVDLALTAAALSAVIAVPFLMIVGLRALALSMIALTPPLRPTAPPQRLPDHVLPVYSVLVALYDEVAALPGLVRALERLDYPAAKLDIILVLESDDDVTRRAAAQLELPGNMRTVVVPAAMPRTKPKALNYALQAARGSFVVIFDAEDAPEPGQLRWALDAFLNGPADLYCVQARLSIHNQHDSWLSRQFTLEYSALFDALLPALARLGLPVPLGGTSNHFRREVLDRCLAWDPYNVTEDADLGIRIARLGGRTGVLASTTWEEAPWRLKSWLRQRTRWLKGWMQTYAVHMRRPRQLYREVGWKCFLAIQALMAGLVLSAIVHPWFYALTALEIAYGDPLTPPQSTLGYALWVLAAINLAVGYLSSIALAAVTAARRRRYALIPHAFLMPAYWMLISFAAYRAIWQLMTAPYEWEKTDHRPHPPSIAPEA